MTHLLFRARSIRFRTHSDAFPCSQRRFPYCPLLATGALTRSTASGSTAQVSTITNGLLRIDGVGSRLTGSGDFSLSSQSLNITNGGAVVVNGKLTQPNPVPIRITDSGSTLTVGQEFLERKPVARVGQPRLGHGPE